jgi:hypothetical protein
MHALGNIRTAVLLCRNAVLVVGHGHSVRVHGGVMPAVMLLLLGALLAHPIHAPKACQQVVRLCDSFKHHPKDLHLGRVHAARRYWMLVCMQRTFLSKRQ